MTLDEPSEVTDFQFTISNEDYSKRHLHSHTLYSSQHVLVSDQVPPRLAAVGCLDDVGQVVQENAGDICIKPQSLIRNDIISTSNFQENVKKTIELNSLKFCI